MFLMLLDLFLGTEVCGGWGSSTFRAQSAFLLSQPSWDQRAVLGGVLLSASHEGPARGLSELSSPKKLWNV